MFDKSTRELNLPTTFALPTYHRDLLTHILLGDYAAIVGAINLMEVLRYCGRVAWNVGSASSAYSSVSR